MKVLRVLTVLRVEGVGLGWRLKVLRVLRVEGVEG